MIQRYIKNNPDFTNFDYFNDSKDTISWLEMEIIATVDITEKNRLIELKNQIQLNAEKWWNEKVSSMNKK